LYTFRGGGLRLGVPKVGGLEEVMGEGNFGKESMSLHETEREGKRGGVFGWKRRRVSKRE